MINTQNPQVDAMFAELEACYLGLLEANLLKAGEIALLKAQVADLTAKLPKPEAPSEPRNEDIAQPAVKAD